MRYLFILSVAFLFMAAASGPKPGKPSKVQKPSQPAAMLNAKDSFSYAFGAYCGGMIQKYKIGDLNWDIFNSAFKEGLSKGDTGLRMDKELVRKVLNDYTMEAMYSNNKTEGAAYMKKRQAEGFITTPSGLMYRILKSGNGLKPIRTDSVQVTYTGRYTDSSIFDSNVGRQAFKTAVSNGAIQGFLEVLLYMDEGSEAEVIIPYQLGYGAEGMRNPYTGEMSIEPYRTLIFTIRLDDVMYR